MGAMAVSTSTSPIIASASSHAESSAEARRRSLTGLPYPPIGTGGAGRSGKAKALEVIQAGEANLAPNSLIL
jgi:hypothetical protein